MQFLAPIILSDPRVVLPRLFARDCAPAIPFELIAQAAPAYARDKWRVYALASLERQDLPYTPYTPDTPTLEAAALLGATLPAQVNLVTRETLEKWAPRDMFARELKDLIVSKWTQPDTTPAPVDKPVFVNLAGLATEDKRHASGQKIKVYCGEARDILFKAGYRHAYQIIKQTEANWPIDYEQIEQSIRAYLQALQCKHYLPDSPVDPWKAIARSRGRDVAFYRPDIAHKATGAAIEPMLEGLAEMVKK